MANNYVYNRILLKISGESLKGSQEHGYDSEAIGKVVARVGAALDQGVEVALVVGAGNIWRGMMGASWGLDRVVADQMGMLATVMNALCLGEAFARAGFAAETQSAIPVGGVMAAYERNKALKALEEGKIVIFAGGTGSPFFTTDTTAALRALETRCDAVLKATKVDGIYSDDPVRNPQATRYEEISYGEAISKRLKIMDSTAFSMCRDNNLPIVVFNFNDDEALDKVLGGDTSIATVVREKV